MKREIIELINQISISLKQYEESRKPLTLASRRWAYFFLGITFFLAFPFFRGFFRNEELTKIKVAEVGKLQIQLETLLNQIETQINPDPASYAQVINNRLLNLISAHNKLQRKYDKVQLSREQVGIFNFRRKPSFLQSGLTLCIENCLQYVKVFREKYLSSSTAQVNLIIGSPPQLATISPNYSSSGAVYPFNPLSREGQILSEHQPTAPSTSKHRYCN
jgi:hypothetical protein